MGNLVTRPDEEKALALRGCVDASCEEAASRIAEADVFLLATGAGWSADSGLAVYRDVAKIEAYAKRGLEYHDICRARWLHEDAALFWGFWGKTCDLKRERKSLQASASRTIGVRSPMRATRSSPSGATSGLRSRRRRSA